jgi:serine/threonine protein phosphatase PrpC
MKEGEIHRLGHGEVIIFSCAGPFDHRTNQDAAVLLPLGDDKAVLAVADGAGGYRSGAKAAFCAMQELQARIEEQGKLESGLREVILDGFERANRSVSALGVGAGTTMAAVTIEAKTVRPFHVGDTAILVVGQHGRIKLYTVSHSPVGYAVEAGFLDHMEALHHDDRHLISNMMGTSKMRIEVGPELELAPRDTLLVASDGVFDNMYLEEIVEQIRKGPVEEVSAALADTCLKRMRHPLDGLPSKVDDLTFIVYRRNA